MRVMHASLLAACALAPQTAVTFDLTTLGLSSENLEARRTAWDTLHLVSALQGLVNREGPRLYVYLVPQHGGGENLDRHWMDVMRQGWLREATLEPVATLDQLVNRFDGVAKGLVVWTEDVPATANLASTLAGVEDLLPVRYDPAPGSLWAKLSARLPVVRDLRKLELRTKNEAYRWAVRELLATGKANPRKLGYYPDAWWIGHPNNVPVERTLLSNHDYFISERGFFFDLGPWDDEAPDDDLGQTPGEDYRTLLQLLDTAYEQAKGEFIHIGGFTPWDQKYTDFTGRRRGGVATEWRFAEITSNFNAFVDADAAGLHAMANASFFRHFPLAESYTQAEPDVSRYLAPDGKVAAKHYVAAYVGDYDSAAWMYQMLPRLWNDPNRGSIPLSWAFNPNLAERFPVGMDHVRRTARPLDSFVAGDSGAGYINPGSLTPPRRFSGKPSGLEAWIRHNRPWYGRMGLDVTGFIIDGDAPPMTPDVLEAYADLSPLGFVAQKVQATSVVKGVPVLRMGADLSGEPEAAAQDVLRNLPTERPSFTVHRTVLWSPTGHRQLFEAVARGNDDVEIVDMRTLLRLAGVHWVR